MKELNKKEEKNKEEILIEDFVEFGDITSDCPGRDYGSYKWNNEKKKWVKSKL